MHLHVEVARRAGQVAERAAVAGSAHASTSGARTRRPWRRIERVRRTATRRSWRNSGSRSSMVPGQVGLDGVGEVGEHEAEALERRQVAGRAGSPGSTCRPRRSTPAIASATSTASPSSGVADVRGDELATHRRPARRSRSARRRRRASRRSRRPSTATRCWIVTAATTLSSPLRRSARRVAAVSDGDGEQGADLDDVGEAGPERPGGRSAANRGATIAGSDATDGARPGQDEGVGAVLEAQPGVVQAAVERVEHGGRRAASADRRRTRRRPGRASRASGTLRCHGT